MRAAFLTLAALVSTLLSAADTVQRAIVPVVGSTAGAFGSHFKTELQLNNRSAQTMKGMIVFTPQGITEPPFSASMNYELAPHATLHFDDIVDALHTTGLGSLDIIPEGKGIPTVVARVFNDGGELGTTGATIPLVRDTEAAVVGQVVTLIAPSDRARRRFNIGIRALEDGATIQFKVYNASGVLVKEREFGPMYPDAFGQFEAENLLQTTLAGDESIEMRLSFGSAIVYSTTTDNITNDPSLSLAAKSDSP